MIDKILSNPQSKIRDQQFVCCGSKLPHSKTSD